MYLPSGETGCKTYDITLMMIQISFFKGDDVDDASYLDRLGFKHTTLIKHADGSLRTQQPTGHSFLI